MSGWQEVNLGDLVTYKKGFAFKSSTYSETGDILIVRVSDTTADSVNIKSCMKISSEFATELKEYKLQTNDVIIATVGSWADNPNSVVGKVIKVPSEANGALLNQNAVRLRCKELALQDFFYYNLKDSEFQGYLLGNAQGSANQASVTLKDIFSYKIKLPSLIEQKAIASVLGSLDDKIDLLHRQNTTLERMAETLFRQWFVEEARSFKLGKIGDLIEGTFGGDWGKEAPEGDFINAANCIRGTDIADLQTGLAKKIPLRFVSTKKLQSIEPKNGDIIFEISGGTETQSTGRATYINNDVRSLFAYPLIFSNFCRLLRPLNPDYTFFIYLYLSYLYGQDEFFGLENGSSGIKNLNYKALFFELDYPMPSLDRVKEFNDLVTPNFSKINQNKKQIQTLEKLRDNLLLKLMSGEVRVI